MSNFIIHNPNHEVIYLNKQRPLIFNQEYNLKHKKKQFADIYHSPFLNELSFLISDQYQPCECLNTIEECPKLKEILKGSKRLEAKTIFEQLRHQAVSSGKAKTQLALSIHNQVLQPHFQSLLSVINSQNPQIFWQILRHLKTDYTTFWIYGLYLSKFVSYDSIVQNMKLIVQERNLDLDIEALKNDKEKRLQIAYESKFLSIFRASFTSIVNVICRSFQTDMIIEKLLICYFVRGRQRKQIEVIKAAMDM